MITSSLKVFLVHGFHDDSSGANNVDLLKSAIFMASTPKRFLGLYEFDYGWTGLHNIISKNKMHSKVLAEDVAKANSVLLDDVYAIGHSNGCALICEAARKGAKFKRVLLINPALPTYYEFSENIGEVLVVHTTHDLATRAAKWGNRIPLLRWFVPDAWGAMGAKGSMFADYNYNLSNYLDGHSALFSEPALGDWGSFLVEELLSDSSFYNRERNLLTKRQELENINDY